MRDSLGAGYIVYAGPTNVAWICYGLAGAIPFRVQVEKRGLGDVLSTAVENVKEGLGHGGEQ